MKQENCYLCHKKLNFWFTSGNKYKDHKICSSCGLNIAKKDLQKTASEFKDLYKQTEPKPAPNDQPMLNFADKIDKLGKKLILGLTIPIFLLFLGLFTFPIGIIFWILSVIVFVRILFNNKR